MSFAQLVAHFNQKFQRADGSEVRKPFALEEGVVVAGFYGMRLESAFETFLDPEGRVIGHQAQLHAYGPHGKSVSPWAPYAVALDEDSIVDLDRLIRTLHVLNATALGLIAGSLFLEVHPWHIARVPRDHGAVFEGILRDCGWSPRQIVLEIAEAATQDPAHMARAIHSFYARGFSVALHQRGISDRELERLVALDPDIIQLGRQHLLAAETSADHGRELAQRVQWIQNRAVRVFLQGVATEHQAQIARWVNADGYQDSALRPVEETTVILVPGYGDSGPGHWQTLWGQAHPAYQRVRQQDWYQPQVAAWVDALDREIRRACRPIILVGHSLGCITIAEWAAQRWADVRGALLVAPADTDQQPFFNSVPLRPFPFPSILVASANDPYLELERAKQFAQHWGSRLVNLGLAGHINVDSGFGPWPEGEALLRELRAGAQRPPAVSLSNSASARPRVSEERDVLC
ncbi:MAG: alpha/beta fold hydrolase [Candidatus Competibacter sp.]|nr:alpha/beta fold hydrolase [Candidatus Competibacter sp.]MDG4606105.1 alpha/beta fold hydrolase [Candidatus Contendobacter sp.]